MRSIPISIVLSVIWFAPPSSTNHESDGPMEFFFPLSDGFPDIQPGSQQEEDVFQRAHGNYPKPNLPPLADDDVTSLQFLAFNEIFEVAYFSDFLANVTNNVTGYEIADQDLRDYVITTLQAIVAQEEVHALQANAVLMSMDLEPIQACRYVFPVSNISDAFNFASTFTDVVMGTVQTIMKLLGRNNDTDYIPSVTARVSNEGEQNGFFRYMNNKIPSSNPLLTGSAREFAWSSLNQMVVVNGSCPNSYLIDLQLYPALYVANSPSADSDQNQTIELSTEATVDCSYAVVYISQQNMPLVVPIEDLREDDGVSTFEATFPASLLQYGGYGLIIFVLTNSTGPFKNVEAVVPNTVAGPYLFDKK
nr:PREDICTED: uncharacterized protein LOC109033648 [Bemisia tabaci]